MGLNDPQWGNKNSGGPPDLEELLRKLNAKVAAMMGGKGGNGRSGGNEPIKGFGGGKPIPIKNGEMTTENRYLFASYMLGKYTEERKGSFDTIFENASTGSPAIKI